MTARFRERTVLSIGFTSYPYSSLSTFLYQAPKSLLINIGICNNTISIHFDLCVVKFSIHFDFICCYICIVSSFCILEIIALFKLLIYPSIIFYIYLNTAETSLILILTNWSIVLSHRHITIKLWGRHAKYHHFCVGYCWVILKPCASIIKPLIERHVIK